MADNEDYFGRSSPGNQSSDQTYLYEQQAGTQRSSSAAYENTGADRALSSIDNYTVASDAVELEDPPPPYESIELPHYQAPHKIRGDDHHYTTTDLYVGPDENQATQNEHEYDAAEYASYEYVRENRTTPVISPTLPSTAGRPSLVDNNQHHRTRTVERRETLAQPRSWLAWSIVSLVLLCLPLGIPAVILSAKVSDDHKKGRYEAAKQKSKAAFILNVIATVFCGLLVFVAVGGILFIIGALACCCASVKQQ